MKYILNFKKTGILVYLVLILLHWADASSDGAKDGKEKPGETKNVKELLVCSHTFYIFVVIYLQKIIKKLSAFIS